MGVRVRALGVGDAEAYARLRAEMLLDSPWAFLGSPGDDSAEDPDTLRARLGEAENVILAVEDPEDGSLVSVAGVYRNRRRKMRHWAHVWGVYTTPGARRRGYSRALLEAVIATARSWEGVEMVGIAVSANSPGALRLYESAGFAAWGREPRVTRVGGETYDEIHLAMELGGG